VADQLTEPFASPSRPATGATATVTAVVVTHRRPRLAGELVRTLVDVEHIAPERVIVVVNGDGGLDDPALESSVTMLRLPGNLGPAAGFKTGIEQAFADPGTQWAYLCEDDVGLLPLPLPRVAGLLERIEGHRRTDPNVGAVVAYGRIIQRRTGNAVNSVPAPGPQDLSPVDVAAWGATLLSRGVVSAGVLPDPEWFFGFEDFDYFLRIRDAGFSVLVDSVAARAVAEHETTQGREHLHQGERPSDSDESWRAYYTTRNFFTLARRHGSVSWIPAHLAYSARRLQLSRSRRARMAIAHGLLDGALGRLGPNPRYLREVGELTNSFDTIPGAGTGA
jgi:GT2 family glycosyltransferase